MKKRLFMVASLFASLLGTSFAFATDTPIFKEPEQRPTEFTDDTKGTFIGVDYADDEVVVPSSLTIHYSEYCN
jgi:hypothetical protein